MPIRIIAVLFVSLVAATVVLFFASKSFDSARNQIAESSSVAYDQVIEMGSTPVASDFVVELAELCYKRGDSGEFSDRVVCYAVHGDVTATKSKIVSLLSGMKNFDPGLVDEVSGSRQAVIYWNFEKHTIEIRALSTAGPLPKDCVSSGFLCCPACASGPQSFACDSGVCCTSCGAPVPQCVASGYQCCDVCRQSPYPQFGGCTAKVCCASCAVSNTKLVMWPSAPVVGQTLDLQISANNAQDWYAAEITLSFDSARLRYDGKTDGNFFAFCPVEPSAQGNVVSNIVCSSSGASGRSGSGVIMTLHFSRVSSGASHFNFNNVLVYDSSVNAVQVTTNSVAVSVS